MLQGTLDMLVLQILALGPMHGWGITQRIEQISDSVYRLETQGWIGSEWRATENNRQAKFYSLTAKGRKQLAAERESWLRLSEAVGRILDAV
jgi:PadR family transcriptional regulator, regulatory protein PadR